MKSESMCSAPFKPLSAEIVLKFSHPVDNIAEEEKTADQMAVCL